MKALSKLLIAVLILIAVSSPAFSQIDKNGGSVYSIFGLGDINYSFSTRSDAMGVLGIGLTGNYSNSLNPAVWTDIRSTLFTTKFNLRNYRSSDGTSTSVRTFGSFDAFSLSIPANVNNGWIINLGLHQYSVINYDIKLDGITGQDKYTQYYSGNGGLSRINFGTSYNITKNIGIGLQFNYVFGNLEKSTKIVFQNTSLTNTDNTIVNSLSGIYFNTGLIFKDLGKLFKSKSMKNLNVGLVFSTPMKLNSKITGRFYNSAAIDSVTLSEGDINVPWGGGLGITNTFGRRMTVSADAYYQAWDNYKYYGNHPQEIKNSLYLGLGMEYLPSTLAADNYLKRVAYRLGVSYVMDYLKVNGENINTMKVSAGARLPVGRYNSIDLLLSYSKRGKDSNGLVLDNMISGGISINIGDLWFLRPKEE